MLKEIDSGIVRFYKIIIMQPFIKLFGDFGVQPVLLLAQVINFAILVFLLNRILYKPMKRMLDERKSRIAKGLSDAEKAAQELAATEEKVAQLLEKAQAKSQEIIKESKNSAQEIVSEARLKAESDAKRAVTEAVSEIEAQKEASLRVIRSEAARLAIDIASKVLPKSLTEKDKRELVKDAEKEIAAL